MEDSGISRDHRIPIFAATMPTGDDVLMEGIAMDDQSLKTSSQNIDTMAAFDSLLAANTDMANPAANTDMANPAANIDMVFPGDPVVDGYPQLAEEERLLNQLGLAQFGPDDNADEYIPRPIHDARLSFKRVRASSATASPEKRVKSKEHQKSYSMSPLGIQSLGGGAVKSFIDLTGKMRATAF
jgi:hypothetical protein